MRGRTVFAAACAVAAGISLGCSSSEKSTGPSGPPVVTSVNGAALPAGPNASIVVIAGSNCGTSQANAAGHVIFTSGTGLNDTATIAAVEDWTSSLIITTVPNGAVTGTMVVKTSGGSDSVQFVITQQAAFSPSAVSWTAQASLAVGVSGPAIASTFNQPTPGTYASFVYVAGGADSTNAPIDSVSYGVNVGGGTIAAWTRTTPLPAKVAFAAAAIASPYNSPATGAGYLYVIGGASAASGTPVSTVYVGTLNASGGVTAWTTTTALPVALHSVGAAIFNGNLYVVGGSAAGNVPVATVYRASIGQSGALGSWQTLTALPFKRSYFGFGMNGIYLYALGGDSGTVTPNDSSLSSTAIGDVVYAQLDVRTGSINATGWVTGSNKLKKNVSKHTAVVAGGAVLITAGLYNGASSGSTEESYASLNADGTTSAFGGATGSNTIQSQGGGNVFNHAAVGFVDAAGAFHVLVVGGDDVNTPTKKHKGSFRY